MVMSDENDRREKERRMKRYMRSADELAALDGSDDDGVRDYLAGAALTGLLLAQRGLPTSELCRLVWHIADVMMEER